MYEEKFLIPQPLKPVWTAEEAIPEYEETSGGKAKLVMTAPADGFIEFEREAVHIFDFLAFARAVKDITRYPMMYSTRIELGRMNCPVIAFDRSKSPQIQIEGIYKHSTELDVRTLLEYLIPRLYHMMRRGIELAFGATGQGYRDLRDLFEGLVEV